ncbi:DNA-binding transcriptional regulator, Lrp family [Halorubrum aquaticum]|uniref:DNA-binding transcriptional regulator, Lrp family n=1 Tax=Halorubrum aquaticum TaxID=387340 RepID=A0A1I3CX67_9EURY|nr:winged helix-turn-helix transcriptional regulator [Halorubrum aquaticum]SFH78966.1 DNA-binding transcriptional regulator, Lrp family [Halorubrum aquaticum]
MTYRMDEIDRRIVHALMEDARNTSAPMIAEGLNVSAGTVRNRIDRLEEAGIIRGYTATIDFERAGGRLTSLYMCTVPAAERERLALAAQSIPGVINVRVLMAGRRDLQVVAVGNDTRDLREIARSLSELDIRIEDEELVQTEIRSPYAAFGPNDVSRSKEETGLVTLGDGTEVFEVAVAEAAPIAGASLEAAREDGTLPEQVILISIERDGRIVQPEDSTVVEADDVVTLIPQAVDTDEALAAFLDPDASE